MGLITERQLTQVLTLQQKLGGQKRTGDLLVLKHFISPDQLSFLLNAHEEALRASSRLAAWGRSASSTISIRATNWRISIPAARRSAFRTVA